MTVYRIKHIPTGLYFIPARSIQSAFKNDSGYAGYTKSNLSKKGKVYLKKPNLTTWARMVDRYYTHMEPGYNVLLPVKLEDWMVEEL